MGLLSEFFEFGGKAGVKAGKGLLEESPSIFKRAAGAIAGAGLLAGTYEVGATVYEASTGRDVPGGLDVLQKSAGGLGDAAGGAYGTFTARAATAAAKGASEGIATGLGLPQGSGTLLLVGLGAVLVLQLVKD
ncbi:MAG: hypothetical protein EPO65_06770 [Dehalococcoidia bacterium]|nr:MAG: hypothetical protein EPO65_06770 [Dehalococcoidia bacterium]